MNAKTIVTAAVGLLLCLGTGARAQTKTVKHVQIAIWNPVQIYDQDASIHGFRLNLIYGLNEDLYGFELGLVNSLKGDLKGIGWGIQSQTPSIDGAAVTEGFRSRRRFAGR